MPSFREKNKSYLIFQTKKGANMSLNLTKYEDEEDSIFPLININIHLRRRTLFYSFNFVFPSFLITLLSIFGYSLPCESGEKIGLRKF